MFFSCSSPAALKADFPAGVGLLALSPILENKVSLDLFLLEDDFDEEDSFFPEEDFPFCGFEFTVSSESAVALNASLVALLTSKMFGICPNCRAGRRTATPAI